MNVISFRMFSFYRESYHLQCKHSVRTYRLYTFDLYEGKVKKQKETPSNK